MMGVELNKDLRKEFEAVADSSGCQLLDCQFSAGVLRLVIDRPEGVSLADCQTVSKQISSLLDVADFGTGRYTLEVSSPGLDRKFYDESDYERFLGRQARITWKDPPTAHKRTVVGRLAEFSAGTGEVVLVAGQDGERYTILLKNIELARLEPEL